MFFRVNWEEMVMVCVKGDYYHTLMSQEIPMEFLAMESILESSEKAERIGKDQVM